MTTTRDAIGLSDRLRFDAARCEIHFSKGVASNIEEAATALDALSAENEHMADTIIKLNEYLTDANARTEQAEARVKELERESDGYKRLYNDEVVERLRAEKQRDAAESRATSAEQERDEAYERAAKVADQWLESSWADEVFAARSIAAAIRRLAAGTEKEGK